GSEIPGVPSKKPAGAAAESVSEASEAGLSDRGSKPVPEAAAGEPADIASAGHPVSAQVVFYDQPTFPGHFYVADCRRWMSVVRGGVEDGSDGSEGLDEEGLGGPGSTGSEKKAANAANDANGAVTTSPRGSPGEAGRVGVWLRSFWATSGHIEPPRTQRAKSRGYVSAGAAIRWLQGFRSRMFFLGKATPKPSKEADPGASTDLLEATEPPSLILGNSAFDIKSASDVKPTGTFVVESMQGISKRTLGEPGVSQEELNQGGLGQGKAELGQAATGPDSLHQQLLGPPVRESAKQAKAVEDLGGAEAAVATAEPVKERDALWGTVLGVKGGDTKQEVILEGEIVEEDEDPAALDSVGHVGRLSLVVAAQVAAAPVALLLLLQEAGVVTISLVTSTGRAATAALKSNSATWQCMKRRQRLIASLRAALQSASLFSNEGVFVKGGVMVSDGHVAAAAAAAATGKAAEVDKTAGLAVATAATVTSVSSLFLFLTNHVLRTSIVLLISQPIGLKLNDELTAAYGALSWQALQAWASFGGAYGSVLPYLAVLVVGSAGLFMGMSAAVGVIADLVLLSNLQLALVHWCLAPMYRMQLNAVIALWRLFNGLKWNPLHKRIDSVECTLGQLTLGSLLFTILTLLLPTTAIFHILFASLCLAISAVRSALQAAASLLLSFPVYLLLVRLYRPDQVPESEGLEGKEQAECAWEGDDGQRGKGGACGGACCRVTDGACVSAVGIGGIHAAAAAAAAAAAPTTLPDACGAECMCSFPR
ncbi:unnamed protein product, partial [Closterium sp. NIES-64]